MSGWREEFASVRAAVRALAPVAYLSDEVDLVTPGTYGFSGWSATPGLKLFVHTLKWVLTNVQATTFATTAQWSLGNNASSFDNLVASTNVTPTAANLNSAIASGGGGPYPNPAQFAILPATKIPDLATPPVVKIITAATGTSIVQAKARVLVLGFLTDKLATI